MKYNGDGFRQLRPVAPGARYRDCQALCLIFCAAFGAGAGSYEGCVRDEAGNRKAKRRVNVGSPGTELEFAL